MTTRWLNTRFAGRCAKCRDQILAGDHALWDSSTKTLTCEPCTLPGFRASARALSNDKPKGDSVTDFSWNALRDQLATSSFLDSSDDLTTHCGIIAAAGAILARMTDGERMREVTWKPIRLTTPISGPPVSVSTGGDPDKGLPVKPSPQPALPRPGGMAARPVDAFAIPF